MVTSGAMSFNEKTNNTNSEMIKATTTATHGLPDLVLPCFTKFNKDPNRSSSANAFKTRELPIKADNSPENVVATIPIGTNGPQNTISCNT